VLAASRKSFKEAGAGWGSYAFIVFVVLVVGFIGFTLYGLPNNAPANDRLIVNPPTTSSPR
jgi:hypothetical protein